MALQSFGTSVGAGIQVNLTTTDSAFIAAGGLISSSNGTAISGTGSDHIVDVQGSVVGLTHAISLGNFGATTDEYVLVEPTGFVGAYSFGAIAILAQSSIVENRGRIYGGGSNGSAVVFSGSTGISQVINTGTMEATKQAILHNGAEDLTITNSGLIKSSVTALEGGAFGDHIVNTGAIVGTINLNDGDDSYTGAAGHLIGHLFGGLGVDTLTGGTDNDRFDGGTGNDTLTGNGGADTLKGDDGNDTLTGGAGKDNLTGGLNHDLFVFNAPLNKTTNVDTITDFSHVDDTIHLENSIFKALGAPGTLKAAFFHIGAAAHDANDHIIYDSSNGHLYYDDDGTGAHAEVQFALLQNKPTNLAVGDFVVI